MKLIARLLCSMVILSGLLSLHTLTAPTAAAAPPKCYVESTSGKVEIFPVCSREMETLSYNMGSLPNPLVDDRCYFWTKDPAAPGQDVTSQCGQPPYSNAQNFGDNAPPPAELPDRPSGSSSNIKVTEDVGNPEYACGGGNGFEAVNPSFDIGCRGQGNPIIDMLFAFVRILTTGVGIAMIISIVIAGMQYTTAGGDPNLTAQAKNRLKSTLLMALPLYLLTYAILNWLIPGIIF